MVARHFLTAHPPRRFGSVPYVLFVARQFSFFRKYSCGAAVGFIAGRRHAAGRLAFFSFSLSASLKPACLEVRNIISTTRRAGRVPQVCGRLLLFATQRQFSAGHLAFFRFLLLPRSLKLDIFFISLAAMLAARHGSNFLFGGTKRKFGKENPAILRDAPRLLGHPTVFRFTGKKNSLRSNSFFPDCADSLCTLVTQVP
jgi:hypothetical protein